MGDSDGRIIRPRRSWKLERWRETEMWTVSTGPEIIIPVDCLLTRLLRRLQDYSSRGMDDAKTNERAEDGMEEEVEGSAENAYTVQGWEQKYLDGRISSKSARYLRGIFKEIIFREI